MEEDGSKKFQVAITIRGHLERVMKSQATKECYKIMIKKKIYKTQNPKPCDPTIHLNKSMHVEFFSMARPLVLFKFQFWFEEVLSMQLP
jgi:hypothetical protein